VPFGKEPREEGTGLALSGGGFRATLFHAGALWRMNELGLLPTLDRVSSISGGSITAGRLAVRWKKLMFQNDVAKNFGTEIIEPLRELCSRNVDVRAVLFGILLPWKSITQMVQESYEESLLGKATLQDLPDRPRFVFNATNFGTGVSFRFSKPYAGDYRIGLVENPNFRVSFAVLASSAFPPILSPAILKPDPGQFQNQVGADLYDKIEFRRRIVLTDGGVYDNLGLQTVWDRYSAVLVSDAGAPFDPDPAIGFWPARQVLRALSITTNQARGLRKSALIAAYKAGQRSGAYWGIASDLTNYGLRDPLPVLASRVTQLASIRTRLNRFDEREQCSLMNWGYAVCDAALRKHYLQAPPALPPSWPYPDYALDRT
jgi:NTE family protein